jgi:hypothetical protein
LGTGFERRNEVEFPGVVLEAQAIQDFPVIRASLLIILLLQLSTLATREIRGVEMGNMMEDVRGGIVVHKRAGRMVKASATMKALHAVSERRARKLTSAGITTAIGREPVRVKVKETLRAATRDGNAGRRTVERMASGARTRMRAPLPPHRGTHEAWSKPISRTPVSKEPWMELVLVRLRPGKKPSRSIIREDVKSFRMRNLQSLCETRILSLRMDRKSLRSTRW